jgi:predicted  nucleic acid-binding Zn-ribbon protein
LPLNGGRLPRETVTSPLPNKCRMQTAAALPTTASRLNVDWTPVRDTLAALRAGHESLDLFVAQLFSGLESMRERLDQHDRRIKEERRRIAEEREKLAAERAQWQAQKHEVTGESPDSSRLLVELEQERGMLEEELETVRRRCEELAQTVADQKRQLTEERAEWTAEFRQLRKILDKQSQILVERVEQNHVAPLGVVAGPSENVNGAAAQRGGVDPVLGSVISQFQLLQKDAARRRQAKSKAS